MVMPSTTSVGDDVDGVVVEIVASEDFLDSVASAKKEDDNDVDDDDDDDDDDIANR